MHTTSFAERKSFYICSMLVEHYGHRGLFRDAFAYEKQSMKLYRVNSSPLRAERSHFSRCKRQHSLKQGATRVSINGNTGSHASQSVMRISWELIQRKLFGISISLEIYTNIQIEDLSKPCRRSKTLIQNSNSIISQTKREFKFRYNTISSE